MRCGMNAPEKQVVRLAIAFFVLGLVVKILPWGLPAIGSFDVVFAQEASSQPTFTPIQPRQDSLTVGAVLEKNSENDSGKIYRKTKKEKPKVQLPLKINQASAEELCALKGVGPKLAERIIAFRNASGPIKTPSDLEKVPGIGKKKLEGILQGVIFD
ncbi:MAG: helix-hairpin-helix domain-containing protein [Fibrobacteraceae bacterium]|nr:helix-hairpin-helix domain-containing protein [Fibrobacteraceae bacterium]